MFKKFLLFNIMFLMFSCTSLQKTSDEKYFHSKPGFAHVHLIFNENELVYSLDGINKKVKVEKVSENRYLGEGIEVILEKNGDLILDIKDKQKIEFYETFESDKENFGHEQDDSHHGHTH